MVGIEEVSTQKGNDVIEIIVDGVKMMFSSTEEASAWLMQHYTLKH